MSKEYEELILSLPCTKYFDGVLYKYQGYWIPSVFLKGTISFQKHFKARESDIILSTCPKSGTTWLKALVFSILNRSHYAPNSATHPLLTCSPHELAPFFEIEIYDGGKETPNLENQLNPRIFSTHLPFSLLPQCITDSNCRIIYICRNPLDQLISRWFFLKNIFPKHKGTFSTEELVETFQEGKQPYGPFWDHVLGYWKKSLEEKDRILFLRYEELKEDIINQINSLANFLGLPFSEEEKKRGMIEEISRLCSIGNLKELEVNRSEEHIMGIPKNAYFRKGVVGDWTNNLSSTSAEKIKKLVDEKFKDSGIEFRMTS
ncbi:hypothetical protein NMG60_11029512 [Bertholletia excelsa]